MKKFFASFPRWTFSIVWYLIAIWLTNAPTLFMEQLSDQVRDIDKFCHAVLGAIMVFILCFDWQRKHDYNPLRFTKISVLMTVGFVLTAILEVCQIFTPEEYRHWFDIWDVVWEGIGAIVMAVAYNYIQAVWTKPSHQSEQLRDSDISF